MRGTEEAQVVLCFLCHRAQRGIPWRRTTAQDRAVVDWELSEKVTTLGGLDWAELAEQGRPVGRISKETT
jgi:hypothetical protein